MLMHIWQHLEISIGCPMCGKGFQKCSLPLQAWEKGPLNPHCGGGKQMRAYI